MRIRQARFVIRIIPIFPGIMFEHPMERYSPARIGRTVLYLNRWPPINALILANRPWRLSVERMHKLPLS